MPKIEKDLLKVKGSDGQWHYIPAVGGGDTPTWDAVQNKPFESLGDGLSVEDGVLSAQGGGGSANAVQYVEQTLTDEQKKQARENIEAPARALYAPVASDKGKYFFDSTIRYNELREAYNEGAAVYLAVGNPWTYIVPLLSVSNNTMIFAYFDTVQFYATKYTVSSNSSISVTFDRVVSGNNVVLRNQGTTNAGKILGIGEDGNVVPQDKPTYTLPQATADALGGIKADAATAEDTQDVRMGADGKLRTKPTGGSSVTVDDALSSASVNPVQNKVVTAALAEKITAPTTAAVGQIIKVKSVDTAGKPTEWEAADLSSGGSDDWTLFAEQTTTEIVREISFTLPKSVKRVVAKIWCPATGAEAVNRYISVKIGASYLFYYIAPNIPDKTMTSQLTVTADSIGGGYWRLSYYANRGVNTFDKFDGYNQNESVVVGVTKAAYTEANTFAIMTVATDTTQQFPAGTILKVWGF